jgi:hypothetical protein
MKDYLAVGSDDDRYGPLYSPQSSRSFSYQVATERLAEDILQDIASHMAEHDGHPGDDRARQIDDEGTDVGHWALSLGDLVLQCCVSSQTSGSSG